VLFHNQGLHTAEALPNIIKELKAEGYEFVKISQLIYKDNYQMRADGSQVQNS
jgi:peptidoglycan/xylan/chitin deacetylase (PgdA/CDA1 family)